MSTIQSIVNTPIPSPVKSPIQFEFTKEAMMHDSKILQSFDCNFEVIIQADPISDLSYGNEFRPPSVLEPLLCKHKDWIRLKGYLLNGFNADFHTMSDDQRSLDIDLSMSRGNHQSAVRHHDVLSNFFEKEVRTGFQCPFEVLDISKIPGAEVSSAGMDTQDTIDDHGYIIEKIQTYA